MRPALPLKAMMYPVMAIMFILFSARVLAKTPGFDHKAGYFFRPPVAGNDYFHLVANTTITGSYFDNDSDPDGDSLSIDGITIDTAGPHGLIQTLPTIHGGTIAIFSDGTFTYTPAVNYIGYDSVEYQICDISALSQCTTAWIIIEIQQGLVLPIQLSQFSGKRSGKDNWLQWTTAQETNSHHFELESSVANNNFVKIAFIPAKGSSSLPQQYGFIHHAPSAAVNYYRLKLVDIDGHAVYSKIVAIKADGAGVILNTVYPNPFRDKIEMAFTANRAEPVSIRIHDISGRVCLSKTEKTVAGLNVITLNGLGKLQPGTYFVEVKGTIVIMQAKMHKAN